MNIQINQESFFSDARLIFQKRKIEVLSTRPQFFEYFNGYKIPENILKNDFIDNDLLIDKLKLIWHAVSATQIELTYSLIYLENTSKKTNYESEFRNKALCSHHISLCHECIYRVWERVSQVLYLLHCKDLPKDAYYNDIVTMLRKSQLYSESSIEELKKHQGQWSKIAKPRNIHSHSDSRLFSFNTEFSNIVDINGTPFPLEEKTPNLKQECNTLINRYNDLEKLNSTLRKFMDLYPKFLIKK